MRNLIILGLAGTALTLNACSKPAPEAPQEPAVAKVLPTIPLPPNAEPLVQQSGTEATQFIMVSSYKPDSVIAYYRKILGDPPFHLISETKTGNMTAFYAEQSGPSIWITVAPNGNEGSQVVIAGASETDSVVKKLAAPGGKPGAPRPVINKPSALPGH